jgi:hypothetical protein
MQTPEVAIAHSGWLQVQWTDALVRGSLQSRQWPENLPTVDLIAPLPRMPTSETWKPMPIDRVNRPVATAGTKPPDGEMARRDGL